MTNEEFKAFCKGRHLSLVHMSFYFDIEDEKTINDYASGALPIPQFISEKIEEIIFSGIVDLPADTQEEKLDQLLSVINHLPHKGAAVSKKIEIAVLDALESKIDEEYLGYDSAFWQEFQRLYEKKCRAEKLYIQGLLFTSADCHHQVG